MDNTETLIQEKIEADTDFQASLADLSDEDKVIAIETKKTEIIKQEFITIAEKAKKNEELAGNYKTRAEKAELALKEKGEKGTVEEKDNFSIKDTIALSKVNEDDIDDVVEVAKVLKLSIPEAMKNNLVKTLLADKEEKRTTASVANTRNTRQSSQKLSDEALLDKASKGEIPESDDDIERLVKAKMSQK